MKKKLNQVIAVLLTLIISITSINVPEASATVKEDSYITVAKNIYYITKAPIEENVGEVILMKCGDSEAKVSVKGTISYENKKYQVVGIAGTYDGKKKADSVFDDSVQKVTLPKNIKIIGKNSFNGCKKLSSLTIPASVEKIEKEAVNNCSMLKKIVLKSRNITLPSEGVFSNVNKNVVVYIPTGTNIKDSFKKKVKRQLSLGGTVKYNISKPQVKVVENNEVIKSKSVQNDTITLNGVVFGNSNIKKVTYQITDEDGKKIKSGNCVGAKKWELSCGLQKGMNIIKISAIDKKGKKGNTKVYIVKVDEEVAYSEEVKAENVENSKKVAQSITNIEERGECVYVTVEDNSELVNYVEDGTLKKGDVYLLQDNEEMPMGFAGIYEGIEEKNGEQIVQFTPATMEDIYPGEVTIDLSGEIDEENPIAYAYFLDGTEMDVESEDLVVRTSSVETEKETEIGEKFKITQTKRNGKTTIEIEFEDVVLYDEDKDEETESDQLRLNGKYEINDLLMDFYFDKDFLSIKQCYNQTSYSEDADIEFEVGAKLETEKVVESLNGGFDNKKTHGMLKLEGIDLSDSIMLGVVGINIATMTPVVSSFQSIQKTSEKVPLMPVIFISFIIHLDGEIYVDVRAGFNATSHNVKGFNLQKKNYIGKYGEFDKSLGDSKTLFGYNFQTFNRTGKSKTDMSSPAEQKLYVEGEGKAEIEVGAGVLGAIMLDGIIPAGFSAYPYFKTEGEISGRVSVLLPLEGVDATGEYYIKEEFGVAGKVAFALTKEIRASQKYTYVLWEKYLQGSEDDKEESADSDENTTDLEEGEKEELQKSETIIEINPYETEIILKEGETYTLTSSDNNTVYGLWTIWWDTLEESEWEVIHIDDKGVIVSKDKRSGKAWSILKRGIDLPVNGKVIFKVYSGKIRFGTVTDNFRNPVTATVTRIENE